MTACAVTQGPMGNLVIVELGADRQHNSYVQLSTLFIQ